MYKLYILGALILVYFLFMNNNIESFSLNFPENGLKCKCDMNDEESFEQDKTPSDNNIVEKFTNYDNSNIEDNDRLDRIYNIYKSPYDETAESYYMKHFSYPFEPLDTKITISGSNDIRYKNIGNSNHKILGEEYKQEENYENYNFGLIRNNNV
jgi:hypothetical protein